MKALLFVLVASTALGQVLPPGGGVTTSGTSLPLVPVRPQYDLKSIVPGDLMHRNWLLNAAGTSLYRSYANVLDSHVLQDGIDIGINANGAGQIGLTFTAPAGATSVIISVPYAQDAAASAVPFGLALTPSNFGSVTASASCAPSASVQTCTVTNAVTAGTTYGVVIATNGNYGSTAGAKAVLGRLQVTPVGATGVLGGNFERFTPGHGDFWFNTRTSWFPDGTINHSPQAALVLDTSAPSITVEAENVGAGSSPTIAYAVYVDDMPLGQHNPPGVVDYFDFVLPPGRHRVKIYASAGLAGSGNEDQHFGCFIHAAYAPAGYDTVMVPPPRTDRRLVVYGDSIIAGWNAPSPAWNGTLQQLRGRWAGAIFSEAWSGRKLFDDVGTAASQAALVSYFAAAAPTDVYFQIGFNDYNGASYTAAAFQTAYGGLLDATHQAIPAATIFAQSLTLTGLETTNNANSEKPPAFRTAQQNACAARTWCHFVDGSAMVGASDLADVAHPVLAAEKRFVEAIAVAIDTPTFVALNPLQHDWAFSAFDPFVGTQNAQLAQLGPLKFAQTILDATYTNGIPGTGGTTKTVKLSSAASGGGTVYVTCTPTCTSVAGTVSTCTINQASVPVATSLFWATTATTCTTGSSGNVAAHFGQP